MQPTEKGARGVKGARFVTNGTIGTTVTMTADEIAEFVGRRREQLGLSLHDLAAQCGVSVSTLSNWASGKNLHSVTAFLRLCDALDVDLVARKIL